MAGRLQGGICAGPALARYRFRRLGYERLPRERAPGFIRRTSECSGLCPASAAFMVKRLDRGVLAGD